MKKTEADTGKFSINVLDVDNSRYRLEVFAGWHWNGVSDLITLDVFEEATGCNGKRIHLSFAPADFKRFAMWLRNEAARLKARD